MIALFAMHVSIFVISPLVIARVINFVNRDKHQFTHEEQQDLVDLLERIEQLLLEKKSPLMIIGGDVGSRASTPQLTTTSP